MAELKTIPETIVIGDGSLPYMINYLAAGQLFGARKLTAPSPTFVAAVTDFMRWRYISDPTDPTLRQVANYALWLYGIFGMQVQAGQGGGSVIPITPNTKPRQFDFKVASNSIIPTGGLSVDLSPYGYIGFDIQFFRGNIVQSINDNGGTYYSYDKTTAILNLLPNPAGAAQVDEIMQISPVI